MPSVNRVEIIGHLGQDPEYKETSNGNAVANLSVATSERWKGNDGEMKEKTEWHRVVAWGRQAEIARDYLHKGTLVYIEGKLQTRKWEDKEGVTKYTTEIVARLLLNLSGKKESYSPPKADDGPPISDDDVPF